jgi:hypothetical protein
MRPIVVAVTILLLAAAPAAAQDGPPRLGPMQVVNLATERAPQYRPLIGTVVPADTPVVFCNLARWERVSDSRWTIEWLRDGAVIETVGQVGDPAWSGMPAGSIVGPARVDFTPWRVLAAAELGQVVQCRVTVTTPFGSATQSAYPLRLFGDGVAAPGDGDAASAGSLRRTVVGGGRAAPRLVHDQGAARRDAAGDRARELARPARRERHRAPRRCRARAADAAAHRRGQAAAAPRGQSQGADRHRDP